MTRLSARGVSVTPPAARLPVVREFDLEAAAGEWVAVTGPNGCGKSSLLMALAGLWPCAGEVRLEGQPFSIRSDPEARRSLAVLLQGPADQLLQPTVAEEIRMAATYVGVPPAEVEGRADRWATALGLGDLLDRPPHELSAGEQQLVLMAAALVSAPTVLLADEPAAHLSTASRARVHQAMRSELDRGLTAVWVTQDPADLAAADRVVSLEVGVSTEEPSPVRSGTGTMGAEPGPRPDPLATVGLPEEGMGRPRGFLELPRRGVVAVTGPNGAGKTRLIRALSRLDPVSPYSIAWAGGAEPSVSVSLEYPEMQISEERVEDELVHSATLRGRPHGEALVHAVNLLKSFELSADLRAARVWSLSAGEKRLVELAATFVAPADLYLLDEPTAGLDPRRRRLVARVIGDISGERSVLVATQDLDWLAGLGCPVTHLDGRGTKR